jgi:hypothetical protein
VSVFHTLTARGRLAEWVATLALAGVAITLALPGDTLGLPSFGGFRHVSEVAVAVPVAMLATIRGGALAINGRVPASHRFRAAGAVAGAAVFGALAVAFAWPVLTGEQPAAITAPATYAALAFGDVVGAWRAGADVGAARRD